MTFYLIGIDYKTAPLSRREAAYAERHAVIAYWQHVNPGQTAVLITCNRIEIYGTASSGDDALVLVKAFRNRFHCFRGAYVMYGERSIFKHGLRLACGLESQLQGEQQIMQQLEAWFKQDVFPFSLRGLWSLIIAIGKEIRMEAGLNKEVPTIADLIFEDLQQRIAVTEKTEIMVIGTGKIATLITERKPHHGHFVFVARKKRRKAERLARRIGGEALLPGDIPARLLTADAVISATSSPHAALTLRHFSKAAGRRNRPLYIYDVAIPRDVAPVVRMLPGVRVQDTEGLISNFYQRNSGLQWRLDQAAKWTEKFVSEYREYISAQKYTDWYTAKSACN